jgi:hypothetical protein
MPLENMTNYCWDELQIKFRCLLIFVLEYDMEKENKLFSVFYKSEKSNTNILPHRGLSIFDPSQDEIMNHFLAVCYSWRRRVKYNNGRSLIGFFLLR